MDHLDVVPEWSRCWNFMSLHFQNGAGEHIALRLSLADRADMEDKACGIRVADPIDSTLWHASAEHFTRCSPSVLFIPNCDKITNFASLIDRDTTPSNVV